MVYNLFLLSIDSLPIDPISNKTEKGEHERESQSTNKEAISITINTTLPVILYELTNMKNYSLEYDRGLVSVSIVYYI